MAPSRLDQRQSMPRAAPSSGQPQPSRLGRAGQPYQVRFPHRLQPLPFCEGTPGLSCTDPQPASVQAVYAGGMLVAAACVQAVLTQYEARTPSSVHSTSY